ncbi:hypothetical protein KHP62_06720 [Rhodobacteraceae bacterium NNCM2]|nr:hypothetical protein [Coraliihabitans acroporae]
MTNRNTATETTGPETLDDQALENVDAGALLLPAVQSAREAARKKKSREEAVLDFALTGTPD